VAILDRWMDEEVIEVNSIHVLLPSLAARIIPIVMLTMRHMVGLRVRNGFLKGQYPYITRAVPAKIG
jgi:hypothetical protein